MNLNEIELNGPLIANLYSNSLILPESAIQQAIKKKEAVQIAIEPVTASNTNKSLGGNKRQVLIVTNYNEAVHLPDENLQFLIGILTACKLSLADVAIINHNNYSGQGYEEITKIFNSKKVLLFGITPADFRLPMNFPEFQLQAFNQITYLCSPALAFVETDTTLKKLLWARLQQLFAI